MESWSDGVKCDVVRVRQSFRTFVSFVLFVVSGKLFNHEEHEDHEGCKRKNSTALPQTILYFSSSGTPVKFFSMIFNDSGQSDS